MFLTGCPHVIQACFKFIVFHCFSWPLKCWEWYYRYVSSCSTPSPKKKNHFREVSGGQFSVSFKYPFQCRKTGIQLSKETFVKMKCGTSI